MDVQNVEQVNEGKVWESIHLLVFTMDMISMWITTLEKNGKGVDVQNVEQVNPVYEGMGINAHAI